MLLKTLKVGAPIFALFITVAASADQYSFISAPDLYDALSQDSMMLRGYFLGVIDAFKNLEAGSCFRVPFAADADQQMIESYLQYWKNASMPQNSVASIIEAMVRSYPCSD